MPSDAAPARTAPSPAANAPTAAATPAAPATPVDRAVRDSRPARPAPAAAPTVQEEWYPAPRSHRHRPAPAGIAGARLAGVVVDRAGGPAGAGCGAAGCCRGLFGPATLRRGRRRSRHRTAA
ncbi:hypothetical protein ACFSTD_15540 [Novosphingobium colocasiae]